MPWFTPEEQWALTLTTFAGLSTSVGAVFAIIKQPDDALLALLLGNAIGVMFLLSVAEMWIHNAMGNGWPEITIAFGLGALLYQVAQPFIPDFGTHHHDHHHPEPLDKLWLDEPAGHKHSLPSPGRMERQESNGGGGGSLPERRTRGGSGSGTMASPAVADLLPDAALSSSRRDAGRPTSSGGSSGGSSAVGVPLGLANGGSDGGTGKASRLRPQQLLRLGVLMSVTMTLHNLPEGFAVAFASFTDFGPIMAAAIAIHNIPEGVIVAAPMYAATGSRWKALGLATASGLSEPLGALLALLLVKPFLTEARLHYILGFVGGLMAAVSVLELWPEARKCRHDRRMYTGIALGMLVMGSTLLNVTMPVNKSKIICTLGPVSRDVPTLCEMLRSGMNIARFNFSHGSHEYHQETLNNLRLAMRETRIMCAVMLDTKGPEIRTGFLEDEKPVVLEAGAELTITTDYSIKGTKDLIAMSYAKLAQDVKKGSTILCADGSISLEVLETNPAAGTVRARCLNTATLGERKNVNLPGVIVDLPTLTEKDIDDLINWGIPNEIDLIAASFVRKGTDLDYIREVLGAKGQYIKIISKVENHEGVSNFDEILAKSDSIMVARGDLGMEIPTEKIFLAQKLMIQKCNLAGKPVVTATQMLESMTKSPRPTRAEATDVANAVLDGTDCVMLSGETAAGAYPIQAVQVMAKICREAEASIDYYSLFKAIMKRTPLPMTPLESLASSAVRTAHKVQASLVVVLTRGGATARLVAKYRPTVPILTVVVPVLTTDNLTWQCSSEAPARQCLTSRGLVPILAEGSARASDSDTTDEILQAALEHAKDMKLCRPGDCVVALHRIGNASVIKLVDLKP
ncbi:pyruvate kinase [Micractinium conductrix]|uniref:Pyruvate kinase n=1 Tax=Micractinium conductrix TaxID=554055 RepID=A0A2P6V7Z2_9CHLO|nr:pyruvate kinase [Micractinium conductrix]|eukprot:PSC70200.1 pyruvate kinase [Micractinium conductrix]